MEKVFEAFLKKIKKEFFIFLGVGILGFVAMFAVGISTSSYLLGFLALGVLYGGYVLITYLRVKALLASGAASQTMNVFSKANDIRKHLKNKEC